MQKKKNLYKKSRYYRQRQKKIRQVCVAAGSILLLVVVILIIRGCSGGKARTASSSDVKTTADSDSQTAKSNVSDSESANTASADSDDQSDTSTKDSSDTASDSETDNAKLNHSAPVTLTVSVVGDCTLGTDENFDYDTSLNAYFESYGKEYFFQNVKSIFEADDLTIANNEGTFTDSYDREDKTFAFKAPASFAGIYSCSSVEAVNTANNHSHDYGEQSFQDTMDALDAEGIVHFGYDETAVMDVKGVKV